MLFSLVNSPTFKVAAAASAAAVTIGTAATPASAGSLFDVSGSFSVNVFDEGISKFETVEAALQDNASVEDYDERVPEPLETINVPVSGTVTYEDGVGVTEANVNLDFSGSELLDSILFTEVSGSTSDGSKFSLIFEEGGPDIFEEGEPEEVGLVFLNTSLPEEIPYTAFLNFFVSPPLSSGLPGEGSINFNFFPAEPFLNVNAPQQLRTALLGSANNVLAPFPISASGSGASISVTPQAVPTPALLPGLIGMGMATLRKRKQKAEG